MVLGIAGLNPADDMVVSAVVFVVCCVVSGLCGELILRSEESYRERARVCVCVCVYDLLISKIRRAKPELVVCATKKVVKENL